MFLNLLAKNFTFDGVTYYKNFINVKLFGFETTIAYYGIVIVFGMILCYFFAKALMKKSNLDPELLLDVVLCVIPIAVIFARIWYVIFDFDSFDSFIDMINIKNGGLAIYGGVIGGAIGVFIASKIKKIPFLKFADIVVCVLPLGQAIGRWGNFFNQEVYGLATNMHFPFGVYIASEGGFRVALFFIESILNLALFIVTYIYFLKRKEVKLGYNTAFYLIGYGVIRGILENFRTEKYNLMVFGLKSQVITAVVSIVIGLVILLCVLKRDKKWIFKEKGVSNGK